MEKTVETKSDAYQTLNLPETASREEIDRAYASLAERFSETNYLGSPLWDMAAEKRCRIREAYSLLCPGAEPPPETQAASAPISAPPLPESSVSVRVRKLLNANDPDGAEALLKAQPELETDQELIYLRGMVAWKRGWLDEAAKYVKQANRMEPKNAEYKAALDKILFAPPSLDRLKKSKKTGGKWACGACGACAGECVCEAVCEVLCDSLCGGC
ncbi:MAG: hypothetical protein IKQ04_05055 [Oscillospiraceae bacterium]|nr:hypothetical protein [Oscillospiraceae bacterium]